MIKTLIKGLMMIKGVRIIVGTFFTQVGTLFGWHIAHFLFLGMRAMESQEMDRTIACASKKY